MLVQSSFGWVDFEEKDRQKMMDVVRMFQETDTRDELGVGSIRDTFSDLLFPGSSTIQTRVKYMFFLPWMFLRHEKIKTPSSEIGIKARKDEVALIYALLASEDTAGVIGYDAKASLQRMPSSVYWAGLKIWGIRRFIGSIEEYYRYLDQFYFNKKNLIRGDDKEPIDGPQWESWDPGLPCPPVGFPERASFDLSRAEAEYLVDKLLTNCKGSLLAHLVSNTKPAECPFIWEHPDYAGFPDQIHAHVTHARNFSFVIHGAALLYNLMLAEKAVNEELTEKYRSRILEWASKLHHSGILSQPWSLEDFWGLVSAGSHGVTLATRRFVEQWINHVLKYKKPEEVIDDSELRNLIGKRELVLKRDRARLHNQRALELWSGAAGTRQLTYRWPVVQGMVNDILTGLGQVGNNA